jgi:hypothetical protein
VLQADAILPHAILQWGGHGRIGVQGEELGVKEAGQTGEVSADYCLHKVEHGRPYVLDGVGGRLDMLIGPAARSRSLF